MVLLTQTASVCSAKSRAKLPRLCVLAHSKQYVSKLRSNCVALLRIHLNVTTAYLAYQHHASPRTALPTPQVSSSHRRTAAGGSFKLPGVRLLSCPSAQLQNILCQPTSIISHTTMTFIATLQVLSWLRRTAASCRVPSSTSASWRAARRTRKTARLLERSVTTLSRREPCWQLGAVRRKAARRSVPHTVLLGFKFVLSSRL